MRIYITESQLNVLLDEMSNDEMTFYEFFVQTKSFLKDLLNKPHEAQPSEMMKQHNITKDGLLSKMKEVGLIKSSERIDEVPVEEGSDKKAAKHYITYKIPRARFKEKIRALYDDIMKEQKDVQPLQETDCGGAMQDGGGNPNEGQFTTPMGMVKKGFWKPAMTRNKDEENGSISMNRLK